MGRSSRYVSGQDLLRVQISGQKRQSLAPIDARLGGNRAFCISGP